MSATRISRSCATTAHAAVFHLRGTTREASSVRPCRYARTKVVCVSPIQLMNGQDVALRIFPDIHIKGGNINLTRAKQLDPSVTELTLENTGELIDKAGGVQVRVRATAMPKFTDLLDSEGVKVERTGIIEVPYVAKKSGEDTDDGDGGKPDQGGNEEP